MSISKEQWKSFMNVAIGCGWAIDGTSDHGVYTHNGTICIGHDEYTSECFIAYRDKDATWTGDFKVVIHEFCKAHFAEHFSKESK